MGLFVTIQVGETVGFWAKIGRFRPQNAKIPHKYGYMRLSGYSRTLGEAPKHPKTTLVPLYSDILGCFY